MNDREALSSSDVSSSDGLLSLIRSHKPNCTNVETFSVNDKSENNQETVRFSGQSTFRIDIESTISSVSIFNDIEEDQVVEIAPDTSQNDSELYNPKGFSNILLNSSKGSEISENIFQSEKSESVVSPVHIKPDCSVYFEHESVSKSVNGIKKTLHSPNLIIIQLK